MTEIPYEILNKINNPLDITELTLEEASGLAYELRHMLLSKISVNGGHLASNLGVVELTISLLRNFDFLRDRIVWDVGHQSYCYKILTGRKDNFDTIRQKGGISGFPKRSESEYDHFDTGHSSTSVSAALGFARASAIKGTEVNSIAVIGDGAMTGGMAFEAMNDAGASGENIIVVLNDNEMSITKNVGGIAQYFSRMRSSRVYSGTNESVKRIIEKIPFLGKIISSSIHRTKSAVKYLLKQNMLFEEMGFQYLGPVDGHDLKKLDRIMTDAKKIIGPVLVHVITKKGKGYGRAEKSPDIYHGVGKFDADNGLEGKSQKSFSTIFGDIISDLSRMDKEIAVVCPAVTLGCGLVSYSKEFPDRYFDVGIAEQHAVTLAAGMACSGLKPVVAGYSTFMQRAYDQILHDVCLMNLHVVFAIDRAGVVGSDGQTHQGVYDVSYLSEMPNIRIYAPADGDALKKTIKHALYDEDGPVAVRYPKGSGSLKLPGGVDPGRLNVIREGTDCMIFSYGQMLEVSIEASQILGEKGISCGVADLSCLKPLDIKGIGKVCENLKTVIFLEDIVQTGSCYERALAEGISHMPVSLIGLNLGSSFNAEGSIDDILAENRLDGKSVAEIIMRNLEYKI